MTFIDLNVIHRYVVCIYLCSYVCITYPCMYGTSHTYPLRLQYLTSSFFSSLEAPVYVRASEDWCIIHQAIQHINHSYIRYIYQYIGQYHHWSFEYLHRVGIYLLVIPLPTLCMMGKIEKKTQQGCTSEGCKKNGHPIEKQLRRQWRLWSLDAGTDLTGIPAVCHSRIVKSCDQSLFSRLPWQCERWWSFNIRVLENSS